MESWGIQRASTEQFTHLFVFNKRSHPLPISFRIDIRSHQVVGEYHTDYCSTGSYLRIYRRLAALSCNK